MKLELSQSAMRSLSAVDLEFESLLRLSGSRRKNDRANRYCASEHGQTVSIKVGVAQNLATLFNPDKVARD